MADFPVSTPVDFDVGGYSTAISLLGYATTAPKSLAWAAADLAVFVPILVSSPVTVYQLVIGAGATAAGNFDVGIYDSAGNRLVSSGATAKGSSTEQVIDIADTTIGPGVYYLAMAADGTNNYIQFQVVLQNKRLCGVMDVASSYVLPATVTFAAAANANIPSILALTVPA